MLGKDTMIKIGFKLLQKFISENNGVVEILENDINEWLARNNYKYSVLCMTDPQKGKVIKIVYSGD